MSQPERPYDPARSPKQGRARHSHKSAARTAGAPYPPENTHGFGPERTAPPVPSSKVPPPDPEEEDA